MKVSLHHTYSGGGWRGKQTGFEQMTSLSLDGDAAANFSLAMGQIHTDLRRSSFLKT